MAAWTLATAQEHLAAWMQAELALASAQEYSINTGGSARSLKRADLGMVANQIKFWKKEVERLSSEKPANGKFRFGAPIDNY